MLWLTAHKLRDFNTGVRNFIMAFMFYGLYGHVTLTA